MMRLALPRRVLEWRRREGSPSPQSAVACVRRQLEQLANSRRRIVVGPWLSELGFELLYWIPFLNWATRTYGIDRERMIAVSRGGAASWYRHIAAEYIDLLNLWTVDEYRQKNYARWRNDGHQPQYRVGALDREALMLVEKTIHGEPFDVLHPELMHQLFRPYWYEKGPFSLLRKHTEYRPFESGHAIDGLPTDYVAVRFYFRQSFPDTSENRTWASAVVAALTRHVAVVVLNTAMQFDEHVDLGIDQPRVHTVHQMMSPSNNLEVQTRVIRHARAFVGTYGGLAHLAPLCGVPSVGFYSHDIKLLPAHIDASVRLGRIMNAPLTIVRADQTGLLSMVLNGVTDMHARSDQ